MRNRPLLWLAACLLLGLGLPSEAAAQSNVSVKGLGLFGNMEMDRRLSLLSGFDESDAREMTATDLEDTAFILLQQLRREGFPEPVVTGTVTWTDGQLDSWSWTLPFKGQVPEDRVGRAVAHVEYHCEPGRLNFYRSVNVTGVHSLSDQTVQGYFLPSGALITRKRDLVFTPGNLTTRTANLLGNLERQGYLQAQLVNKAVEEDPVSGAVDVTLEINQGLLHRAGMIRSEVIGPDESSLETTTDAYAGDIPNLAWLRDRRQDLLNAALSDGYPDAAIQTLLERRPGAEPDILTVDVTFVVRTGEKVTLSALTFHPEGLLRDSILNREVEINSGEPYDLLAIEEGRRNLLSLGVLSRVEIVHEPTGPGSRMAVYTLTPQPRTSLRLLAGYGSYERLRVGLRWRQLNLWRSGHRYELDLKRSTRSYNADLTYIVPQLLDRDVTGYARIGHEFREEITFDRTTSTFLFGGTRQFQNPDIELSAEYALEIQETDRSNVQTFVSTDKATVSSLSIRASHDRRDNALYPTSGYDASMDAKIASEILGGNANFQKVELAGSYHRSLFAAMYLHLSLRYGVIFSESPSSENLPFNERFFLGGETTIRGYRQGEASPVDGAGQLIGAETYALANVEVEQRIFQNLSIVAFWDGLAQSVDFEAAPNRERLHSVGLGIRLRTPVGPVRLEYGHNLNRRPGDPEGTLHFAVGYPF